MRVVPGVAVRRRRGDDGNTTGAEHVLDHPLLIGHEGLHDLDCAVCERDSCGLGPVAECLLYTLEGITSDWVELYPHRSTITGRDTAAVIVSELNDDVVAAHDLADESAPETFADVGPG